MKMNLQKMKKLQVVKENDSDFVLKDENGKIYEFNIRFIGNYDIKNVKYFYFFNELLDENYIEYSKKYLFGDVNSCYGRKINKKTLQDLIKIEYNNEKLFLKRFYG